MDNSIEKVATFHNHYGAMMFRKRVSGAKLAPVPRALSSSCGTAAFFSSGFSVDMADENLEAVYEIEGSTFRKIYENKE